MIKKMLNGKFVGDNYYFGTTSNGVGLLGFMTGQEPAPGVPNWVLPEVRSDLDQMLKGSFDRFTIFSGPLRNNKGEIVVENGAVLEQSDLEGLKNIPKRDSCTICMNWLVEGVTPEAVHSAITSILDTLNFVVQSRSKEVTHLCHLFALCRIFCRRVRSVIYILARLSWGKLLSIICLTQNQLDQY